MIPISAGEAATCTIDLEKFKALTAEPFGVDVDEEKLDSAHQLLENIDRRLAAIEKEQRPLSRPPQEGGEMPDGK